jgi:hypothetical protein
MVVHGTSADSMDLTMRVGTLSVLTEFGSMIPLTVACNPATIVPEHDGQLPNLLAYWTTMSDESKAMSRWYSFPEPFTNTSYPDARHSGISIKHMTE